MLYAGSLVFVKLPGPVDLGDFGNWWTFTRGADWRHPTGAQSSIGGRTRHPVVHVTFGDAEAFARWEGKELPTERSGSSPRAGVWKVSSTTSRSPFLWFSSTVMVGLSDKPADDMQILRDTVRADKKLLVATNMELTESEATGFWPIYEQYQKDLQKINRRLANLVESYRADFRSKSLTDDKAKKLIDEPVGIELAEAKLQSEYAPKLGKVLPVKKVARYLQIENKIRAVVKYDLASGVPPVQ
jgi:hypothetical protein